MCIRDRASIALRRVNGKMLYIAEVSEIPVGGNILVFRHHHVDRPRNSQFDGFPEVGSHFSTFYSDRYLTTSRVKAIHDALAGIPYEHIIILANTEEMCIRDRYIH